MIQSTGYFRCTNCNSAGEWELTTEFIIAISALLVRNTQMSNNRFFIGEYHLYDGSWHKYSSDGEEHLLKKIMSSPTDAYLWNRLGNLYFKGGRGDLAVSAFEHSLELDSLQTESLFSLGSILSDIGEKKEAAHYFHRMLVSASLYNRLPAANLLDFLSNALRELLDFNLSSNGEISFIPPKELYGEIGVDPTTSGRQVHQLSLDTEVFFDRLESFYPIAELFMGKQSKKLHSKKRMKKKKRKKK